MYNWKNRAMCESEGMGQNLRLCHSAVEENMHCRIGYLGYFSYFFVVLF